MCFHLIFFIRFTKNFDQFLFLKMNADKYVDNSKNGMKQIGVSGAKDYKPNNE